MLFNRNDSKSPNGALLMTEEDQTLLINKLKEVAGMHHCYNKDKLYDAYDESRPIYKTVENAEEYGMITFARTLLECLGIDYE